MRKALPYIITVVVLVFLGILIVAANKKLPQSMDERITLKHRDKIPYGMAAAKSLLPSLFPNASIYSDNKAPGYWKDINTGSDRQAVILVSKNFNADEFELGQLLRFADNGNYVFIIAKGFSTDAEKIFDLSCSQDNFTDFFGMQEDSLQLQLEPSSFPSDSFFVYPGKKYESWLYALDSTRSIVLGRNGAYPDFVRMNRGAGAIFIHTAPLAFSNYFILHKNNINYFEQVMSVIPADTKAIVWNEYYLTKPASSNQEGKTNWLAVLFRYPPFKWGLLTAIFGLLLYVLMGSRRKQRMIPGHPSPRNDSLDFIKTMGRLYHDKRDHRNLANKMKVYFLEHVRSAYKLPTQDLDENFVEALQFKSGYGKENLGDIVSFIHYLQSDGQVSEEQLLNFHSELELFYQNT
jgi:hypothetical protein